MPATVILLLIAMAVQQFRQAPSVKAAEMLHKAIAAADSRPRMPRRIQIRTHTQRLTRLIGSTRAPVKTNPDADSLAGLESMFRAAHYSWEDPLSAKSYSEWRDQLPDKHDEITSEGDRYRLRTTTDSGELVEATLKLSSRDLRAVEGTLQFRNREWVEISELPPDPAPDASTPEVAEAAPALSTEASTQKRAPALTLRRGTAGPGGSSPARRRSGRSCRGDTLRRTDSGNGHGNRSRPPA